jgi:predicted TIM-barrel fold metal-dependent hydrolase
VKATRREVLGGLAALAGCALIPEDAPIPIIDTHQHLWDLGRFRPPWLRDAGALLHRNYVTRDYLEATRGLNVAKAVYMEIDVAPQDHGDEAVHAISLCRSGGWPTVAAVISGRPAEESFRPHVLRFKASPWIKGVRQILNPPSAPRGFCLQPSFVGSMRLLGELDLSFDFCMRPGELSDAAALASRCPETRFILDHCGNPDLKAGPREAEAWRRGVGELARRPNVACKISGIVAGVPKEGWGPELLAPVIDHCLDSFGPDRVVFGSDWPVCLLGASLAEWVGALLEVIRRRPEIERRKLLCDNALRLYRLA